jgi:hypothetical protein
LIPHFGVLNKNPWIFFTFNPLDIFKIDWSFIIELGILTMSTSQGGTDEPARISDIFILGLKIILLILYRS